MAKEEGTSKQPRTQDKPRKEPKKQKKQIEKSKGREAELQNGGVVKEKKTTMSKKRKNKEEAEAVVVPSSPKNDVKKAAALEEEAEGKQSSRSKNLDKTTNNHNKKKKKKKKEEENKDEEKGESSLYKFPISRVSRIIKSEDPDIRMSHEALFLVNKASEKFLELFCREVYASVFLDRKNNVGYDHLSSVVSKRKRFDFLSDFVPKKVKAEDALAQVSISNF